MTRGRAIMIQGTSSYAGKTLVVAALCRILARERFKVAPFKAQNMSLNSYVTPDGREIARAQALQALAAGVEPTAEMNPILLKPKRNTESQVMLMGRPYRDVSSQNYYGEFARVVGTNAVKKSLRSLLAEFEVVVIEGAGSPAEINLYDREIANMKVARLARAPVFLVADIDRGGVFASIVGTISLLKPADRKRVKGIIINKFRGDQSILEPGLKKVERITHKRVLGVMPYVEGLELPWEDSVSLDDLKGKSAGGVLPDVVVVRFPLISNFTDVHPLVVGGMRVRLAKSRAEFGEPDAIILPGTKNTVHDLEWMRKQAIDEEILAQRARGVPIMGICGGYQMLGRRLLDPKGLEGGKPDAEYLGLGLLDVETQFSEYKKRTQRVTAQVTGSGPILTPVRGRRIRAYEIHMGETRLGSDEPPFRIFPQIGRPSHHMDGAVSKDGMVFGCYLHGLFDDGIISGALRRYLSRDRGNAAPDGGGAIESAWLSSLDLLCETFLGSVDLEEMLKESGIRAKAGAPWKSSERAF